MGSPARDAVRRAVNAEHALTLLHPALSVVVVCSCGWERVAKDDEKAARMAELHLVMQEPIFEEGTNFRRHMSPTERTRRRGAKGHRRERIIEALLDANPRRLCFWCVTFVDDATFSIEHLIPLGKGGSNDLDNLAIAHKQCNERAVKQQWRASA